MPSGLRVSILICLCPEWIVLLRATYVSFAIYFNIHTYTKMLSWCHAITSISRMRNKTSEMKKVECRRKEMKCSKTPSNSSLFLDSTENIVYTATGMEYLIFAFLSFFVNLARSMYLHRVLKRLFCHVSTACFSLFLWPAFNNFCLEKKKLRKCPSLFIYQAFFLLSNGIFSLILNVCVKRQICWDFSFFRKINWKMNKNDKLFLRFNG